MFLILFANIAKNVKDDIDVTVLLNLLCAIANIHHDMYSSHSGHSAFCFQNLC